MTSGRFGWVSCGHQSGESDKKALLKDSEKTREERWAHKEAKQRELEEVEDFLS